MRLLPDYDCEGKGLTRLLLNISRIYMGIHKVINCLYIFNHFHEVGYLCVGHFIYNLYNSAHLNISSL